MRDCRSGCYVPSPGANAVEADVYAQSDVLSVVQILVLRKGP